MLFLSKRVFTFLTSLIMQDEVLVMLKKNVYKAMGMKASDLRSINFQFACGIFSLIIIHYLFFAGACTFKSKCSFFPGKFP